MFINQMPPISVFMLKDLHYKGLIFDDLKGQLEFKLFSSPLGEWFLENLGS